MIVDIRDVNKNYIQGKMTVNVLKDINLSVDAGEYIAIMGPSGSGKTTLMRMLCTLLKPTGGDIYCNGKDNRLFRCTNIRRIFTRKSRCFKNK